MLLAILLSLITTGTQVHHVDVIERNHFHDERGREVFEQWIFREWKDGELSVVDWRMKKDQQLTKNKDGWLMALSDGDKVILVQADKMTETFTQYDPELAAREKLPKERRRGIR